MTPSTAGRWGVTAGITPELVRQPLEEIPEDSTCIRFLRARAEAAFEKRASGSREAIATEEQAPPRAG